MAEVALNAIRSHRRIALTGALVVAALIVLFPWVATLIVLFAFGSGVAILFARSEVFGQRVRDEDFEDWF